MLTDVHQLGDVIRNRQREGGVGKVGGSVARIARIDQQPLKLDHRLR